MRILAYSFALATLIMLPWYLHEAYLQSHVTLEITTAPSPYGPPTVYLRSGTNIHEIHQAQEVYSALPSPHFIDRYCIYEEEFDEIRINSHVPPDRIDQVSARLTTPDGRTLAKWDHTAFQPISLALAKQVNGLGLNTEFLFPLAAKFQTTQWQIPQIPPFSWGIMFFTQFVLSMLFLMLFRYLPFYRKSLRHFFDALSLASPSPFAKDLSPLFLASLCLGTMIVLSVAIDLIFGTYYGTVDDPLMTLISKGYMMDAPDWHSRFMHPFVGYLLVQLYRLVPHVPWYVLGMGSLNIAGMSAVFYAILRRSFSPLRIIFCLLLVFIPGLYLIACTQFTMVSNMACLAAIALLLGNQGRPSISRPRFLAIAVFFFTGAAIRFQPAMLFLALFGPYFLYLRLTDLLPGTVRFVAIALATLVFLNLTETAAYNLSPQWREARTYDVARGKLAGTEIMRAYADNADSYRAVGWTQNDLAMFNFYIGEDPNVFSVEKFNYLINHLHHAPFQLASSLLLLIGDLQTNFHAIALYLLWLYFALSWRVISPFRALILLAPCVLVFVYLANFLRLPERVLRPTLFAELAILLLVASATAFRPKLRSVLFGSIICLFVSAYLLLDLTPHNYEFGRYSTEREQSTVDSIKRLSTPDSPLIINTIVGTSSDQTFLWQDYPELNNIRIFQLDFFNSPVYENRLKHAGIQNAFVELTYRNDMVIAVTRWDLQQIICLEIFLREHYDINANFQVAKIPHTNEDAIFPYFTLFKASAN